jgi:hypothetical protein
MSTRKTLYDASHGLSTETRTSSTKAVHESIDPKRTPPPVYSDKQAQDQHESSARLETLFQKASRTLFRAKSVFPFDPFPDEVIIDDNKVDIVYGLFFFTKKVFTIPIHTLNGAVATADLFFGTLTIEISGYNENPQPVRFLRGADAMRARRLINGLIIAYKEGVDIELIETERLRKTIEEIGTAI